METRTEKFLEEFEEVLEKNRDAQKGFAKAAENAKHPGLKSWFQRKSLERIEFNRDLEREILSAYPNFDVDGSFAGTIHRAWMDVKAFFSTDNDESMLEEAIRGERAALDEYDDLLEEEAVPANLRTLITMQRQKISADLEKIKTLEDLA